MENLYFQHQYTTQVSNIVISFATGSHLCVKQFNITVTKAQTQNAPQLMNVGHQSLNMLSQRSATYQKERKIESQWQAQTQTVL